MLTCQQVAAKASLLVDGELGFRERTAVRVHLMMCLNCSRFIRQFRALVSGLASHQLAPDEEISPKFVDTVMEQLDCARESPK